MSGTKHHCQQLHSVFKSQLLVADSFKLCLSLFLFLFLIYICTVPFAVLVPLPVFFTISFTKLMPFSTLFLLHFTIPFLVLHYSFPFALHYSIPFALHFPCPSLFHSLCTSLFLSLSFTTMSLCFLYYLVHYANPFTIRYPVFVYYTVDPLTTTRMPASVGLPSRLPHPLP